MCRYAEDAENCCMRWARRQRDDTVETVDVEERLLPYAGEDDVADREVVTRLTATVVDGAAVTAPTADVLAELRSLSLAETA